MFFKQLILDLLRQSSVLGPERLIEEIIKVKSKHRSSKYCDELMTHCKDLIKS